MIRPKIEQQAGLSGTGLWHPNATGPPQMAEPSYLCTYIQVIGNWQGQQENIWDNVCIHTEGDIRQYTECSVKGDQHSQKPEGSPQKG